MPYLFRKDHKLFYREQGEGPLLLILPASGTSSLCYRREMNYFSQVFHTVALDLPGTGQSDRLAVWPDSWWQDAAGAAAKLVEGLGEQSCLVMGSGSGGVCALLMAALYPSRVSAVVADSCVARQAPQHLRNILAERAEPGEAQVDFWKYAHGADWREVIRAESDLLGRIAAHGGDWLAESLPQVRCPVLLTASLGDSLLPDISAQVFDMSRQMRRSQIFLIREGDHPLMWTCLDDFRCACDSFFESVLVRAGAV